jgi:hypothetical protein
MRYKQLKLIAILLLSSGLTGLHAQEANPAAGGNALGSGGSASYTIGQVVYQTLFGTNASMAEGVQQPYEISVITGFGEAKCIGLTVSAYPNPVGDFLMLNIENNEFSTFSFQLCDTQGKPLHKENIASGKTSIGMNNLKPAIYFLKISQNNKYIKTFKIIKN